MFFVSGKARAAALCTGLFLLSGVMSAGEKATMHCFAFTAVEGATQADWDAFYKATDALPKKIKTVKRVWYGKLARPLAIYNVDADTRKKMTDQAPAAEGKVTRLMRQYGVCMEMTGPDAVKAYADNPAHKEWDAVYSKVRVAGTTTYDIIGQ